MDYLGRIYYITIVKMYNIYKIKDMFSTIWHNRNESFIINR